MMSIMDVIHVSEADAERDFAALLKRVRAGHEVVIDSDLRPVVVLRAVAEPRRTVSESIILAESRARAQGALAVMDGEFASDMRDIVSRRRPRTAVRS